MQDTEQDSKELQLPDYNTLLHQSISEGVYAGILGFVKKNNVKLEPVGKKSPKVPLKEFVSRLLAEYMKKPKGYPYKDSFRQTVEKYIDEESIVLRALYANRELDNFVKFCHVIGGAAVANFLEERREETLSLILKIRDA